MNCSVWSSSHWEDVPLGMRSFRASSECSCSVTTVHLWLPSVCHLNPHVNQANIFFFSLISTAISSYHQICWFTWPEIPGNLHNSLGLLKTFLFIWASFKSNKCLVHFSHKALCRRVGRMFIIILMSLKSPFSRALTLHFSQWYLGLFKLNTSRNWVQALGFAL